MALTAFGYAFKLAFQLSPIYLTGGSSPLVSAIPGGIMPLIMITEPLNAVSAFATGNENVELDDFFAHFQPLPGATLIDNQVALYPFANQAVAANALVSQPLQISMKMICPVRATLGYGLKLATMTALQMVLSQHNASGGTYTVCTPSYIYTNCIMTGMRDVSGGETHQPQWVWQLDFMQPLLTQQAAQGALSSLMGKFTSATQTTSSAWTSSAVNVGQTAPALVSTPGMSAVGATTVDAGPLLGTGTGAAVTATPLAPLAGSSAAGALPSTVPPP